MRKQKRDTFLRGSSHESRIQPLKTRVVFFCSVCFLSVVCNCSADDVSDGRFTLLRERMVKEQIEDRGVTSSAVLKAMRSVKRHLFVPPNLRWQAYDDHPLPIGYGQTISQPYIVALMTEALAPDSSMTILEIGTGSGYQAAVLARLCKKVYSIEIVEQLGKRAKRILEKLGYLNVKVRIGDGYKGWKEEAPFDAIIVTCAPTDIPQPLIKQLKEGGKMILPVGKKWAQELVLLTKKGGEVETELIIPVRFVPMVDSSGSLY